MKTPETRARISRGLRRYNERRRAMLRVVPSDLGDLRIRDVAPALAPIILEAHAEAEALHEAMGGSGTVTPQQAAILDDLVRVGVVLRGELSRYLRTQDPDAGSRIGTLATTRRASLMALGLHRVAKDVDLRAHLAARAAQDRARKAIDVAPVAEPAQDAAGAKETNEEGA